MAAAAKGGSFRPRPGRMKKTTNSWISEGVCGTLPHRRAAPASPDGAVSRQQRARQADRQPGQHGDRRQLQRDLQALPELFAIAPDLLEIQLLHGSTEVGGRRRSRGRRRPARRTRASGPGRYTDARCRTRPRRRAPACYRPAGPGKRAGRSAWRRGRHPRSSLPPAGRRGTRPAAWAGPGRRTRRACRSRRWPGRFGTRQHSPQSRSAGWKSAALWRSPPNSKPAR